MLILDGYGSHTTREVMGDRFLSFDKAYRMTYHNTHHCTLTDFDYRAPSNQAKDISAQISTLRCTIERNKLGRRRADSIANEADERWLPNTLPSQPINYILGFIITDPSAHDNDDTIVKQQPDSVGTQHFNVAREEHPKLECRRTIDWLTNALNFDVETEVTVEEIEFSPFFAHLHPLFQPQEALPATPSAVSHAPRSPIHPKWAREMLFAPPDQDDLPRYPSIEDTYMAESLPPGKNWDLYGIWSPGYKQIEMVHVDDSCGVVIHHKSVCQSDISKKTSKMCTKRQRLTTALTLFEIFFLDDLERAKLLSSQIISAGEFFLCLSLRVGPALLLFEKGSSLSARALRTCNIVTRKEILAKFDEDEEYLRQARFALMDNPQCTQALEALWAEMTRVTGLPLRMGEAFELFEDSEEGNLPPESLTLAIRCRPLRNEEFRLSRYIILQDKVTQKEGVLRSLANEDMTQHLRVRLSSSLMKDPDMIPFQKELLQCLLDSVRQSVVDAGTGHCEHGNLTDRCRDCGTGYCEHGNPTDRCRDCGTGHCEHGNPTDRCRDCGTGHCEHGNIIAHSESIFYQCVTGLKLHILHIVSI
ncbi:hypothetical protein DFS34DRAFT_592874 [Phlyctochytrium arcticum]|nr:hypothetical protein DFS34DRAFT_592874 [Phlyctochytrium arcticum]